MTGDRLAPDDPRADRELWDLVAAVPVPAAGDDFMPWLRARLEGERDSGVLPGPEARARRGSRRLLIAVAAAAAVAAVVAFAVLPAMRGTPTATAADMLASMDRVAGGAHTVRLTIKQGIIGQGGSPAPSSPRVASEQLIMSTSGDVRYTASAKSDAYPDQPDATTYAYSTYDERRHQMMRLDTVVPDDGASVLVIERPSWGTDLFETWAYANFQSLAGSLRERLAEGDPHAPVTETTYLGRPAWHADLTEHLPGTSADPKGLDVTWSVTVDKATGLMMRSDYDMGSGADTPNPVTESFWVTRLEVDPPLPKGWQRVSQPGQERIGIYDVGTRFGSPQSVARRAWPTLVLIPRQVPAGYRLTDVASTNFEGMKRSPKTRSRLVYLSYHHPHKYHWVMTSVDASVQRVVARYRRGFSTFVIDIRPLGSRSVVPSAVLNGTDVTLTSGYLKGRHASVSISPNLASGPALATRSDRSKITISGDLTRQELIDVADSLKVYGNVSRPLPAGYGQ
jgi:hypothetical protein